TASLGVALVGRPIAAAYPDAADALAVDDYRKAAFHGGPAFGAGRERKPERMRQVERLRLRALRRSRPLVGGCTDRFGGGRMHGVKTPAVHTFERDQVAARIGDGARDRDAGLARLGDGRRHHLPGAGMGQALAVGDIHGLVWQLARRLIRESKSAPWNSAPQAQGADVQYLSLGYC